MPRVVVTGLGAVTPIGIGAIEFHQAQLNGISGIRSIQGFDTSGLPVTIAGEIDIELEQWFSKRELAHLDRFASLALIATKLALKDGELNLQTLEPHRVGTFIGTAIGGLETNQEQSRVFWEKGPRSVSPFTIPKLMSNSAAAHVAMHYGITGPSSAVVTACSSGNDALVSAYQAIISGEVDVAIAGGSEAPVNGFGFSSFSAMQALSKRNDAPQRASRPFTASRDGFVLAEGAGILILEDFETARRRGAQIYAEFLGFGRSSDAYHISSPHPEEKGASLAMAAALSMAKVNPSDVGYINAHGTSTKLNDLMETLAIKRVFQHHASNLSVSSTKSMIGHSLGAAGAIEAIATVQALYSKTVPPTINYDDPDPQLDLDFVPNEAQEKNLRYALSNSFAFGGHNVSLLLGCIDS